MNRPRDIAGRLLEQSDLRKASDDDLLRETITLPLRLFAKGSCADNVARARELLAVAKPEGEPTAAAVDPSKPTCPCCGGRMVVIEVFARGATPRHRPTAPTTVIRLDTS